MSDSESRYIGDIGDIETQQKEGAAGAGNISSHTTGTIRTCMRTSQTTVNLFFIGLCGRDLL